jgi:hypothetical protein
MTRPLPGEQQKQHKPHGAKTGNSKNGYTGGLGSANLGTGTKQPIIVSDKAHMSRARIMQRACRPHLVRYRGDFMDFVGGAYRILDDEAIKTEIWRFLEKVKAKRMIGLGKNKKLKVVPFDPNRYSAGETEAALVAVAFIDTGLEMPCWLNGRNDMPPKELIAFPNGYSTCGTTRCTRLIRISSPLPRWASTTWPPRRRHTNG